MSVYEEVTQAIIAELEQGVPSWVKSWQSHLPQNLISKREYRGINVILLWSRGYTSPYWLTFRQAGELGGKIRKGEKATRIVYTAVGKILDTDETTGEELEKEYRFLKFYHVFNIEQTEGIAYEKPETKRPSEIIEEAEAFLGSVKAKVRIGGNKAYYTPLLDEIHLPNPSDFESMAAYYATSFHECVHWSGHHSRLNRPLINRFGTEEYAEEELVAELGAAFLCSHLHIPSRLREDHAAYINGWIQILKEDKRAIFRASSLAAKAADYLRAKVEAFAL